MDSTVAGTLDRAPLADSAGWRLEQSYAQLPSLFHEAVEPTPVRAPKMVRLNGPLADTLGLDPTALAGADGAALLSGNRLPPGASPRAQAYAGHQYGHFTTLGDGRAILLGEQVTPRGERFDVQLKGSGPTPYSRRGDGRAALGPMLREYIISEAMHALGIPTTRSLAVVATGEQVWRQEGLPGAVLTRIAASHLRVGTFQWAAARGDETALQAIISYTIQRHYPHAAAGETPALALLDAVIERQAALIAQWMCVGFVHGVMNTDNMAISGETIDYGPCAFIDAYDPMTVFSSIDRDGRYAFGHQPRIAQWNLARFAETLLPVLNPVEATAISIATRSVRGFTTRYEGYWLAGMRRKLGIFNEEADDKVMVDRLLSWMQRTQADYTNTFATLATHSLDSNILNLGPDDTELAIWHSAWRARLTRQPHSPTEAQALRLANCPAFIPRNHRVEAALAAASERDDLKPLDSLMEILATPFNHARAAPEYRKPAPHGGEGYQTFCGT